MIDTRKAPYAATLLRLSIGVMFIMHAYLKLAVFTMDGTVQFFESLGYPGFVAYLTVVAELGGGALLILGVYTRYVAAALVPILLGATMVHIGNGWVFSAEGGGYEYPLFLIAASATQILLGDGAYALKPGNLLGEERAAGEASA